MREALSGLPDKASQLMHILSALFLSMRKPIFSRNSFALLVVGTHITNPKP